MTEQQDAFVVQGDIRQPWRRYLDLLVPLRPDLHHYCCRLTGNPKLFQRPLRRLWATALPPTH